MAIALTNVGGTGLFDVLGKAFQALTMLETARVEADVPSAVQDFVAQFALISDSPLPDWQAAMSGTSQAGRSWQESGDDLIGSIATAAANLVIQYVQADVTNVNANLQDCLTELIHQMTDGNYYVAPSTATVVVAAGGSNVGDQEILASRLNAENLPCQNLLAEVLTVSVITNGQAPTLRLRGENAAPSRFDVTYPAGSGVDRSITALAAASSLVPNGDFSANTVDADLPDGWVVTVGQPGTTVTISTPEEQTVAISGTPTGGTYVLKYTDPAALVYATYPLAYNATEAQVQAALRTLPGLEDVTVSTSGTTPDYTHTITFVNVPGSPAQLTSVRHLTGGTPSIAHATTAAGPAASYSGHSLMLLGDGAEHTDLYCRLPTLTEGQVYHASLRAMGVTSTSLDGSLVFSVNQGIGGSTLGSTTSNISAIGSAGHTTLSFSFAVPAGTPQPLYLRLQIATAQSTGNSVYIDEVSVVAAPRLYPEGLCLTALAGNTATNPADTWTVTVTNDPSDQLWQYWFERCFGMRAMGLQLPYAGSTEIPDSLIA